jgi:SAM-dependent methyltransferase
MRHIEIPGEFHRNSPNVLALGVENTGSTLLSCGNELLGWPDLTGKDVLDIGCGVRFTQTIINRDVPVGTYTGIDVEKGLIDFLRTHVQDSRFSFHHWPVHNKMYNPTGQRLSRNSKLPLPEERKFDLIWMYSVITHTCPLDTLRLLFLLKKYLRDDGGLLFSAFTDPNLAKFDDRIKGKPLLNAFYGEEYLEKIISLAGWRLEVRHQKKPDTVMQNLLLCRPKASGLGRRFAALFKAIRPARARRAPWLRFRFL